MDIEISMRRTCRTCGGLVIGWTWPWERLTCAHCMGEGYVTEWISLEALAKALREIDAKP